MMLLTGRLTLLMLVLVPVSLIADTVTYWDWGHSPKRDSYQYALLQKVLEVTVATHGPFSLSRVPQELSTSRARREINNGSLIRVRAGPYIPAEMVDDPAEVNRPVKTPIMFNLLGFQRLILQRKDLPKLQGKGTLTNLKPFTIGLGKGWVDVDIYRHNGFTVNDGAHVTTLLAMLEQGRFDLMPATLMDYTEALARASEPENLVMAPNLVIHYPFPWVFYVGINDSSLSERIAAGLDLLLASGELQKLFEANFSDELEFLNQKGLITVTLENPYLSDDFSFHKFPGLIP
jgi:hypothetical protein